MVKILAKRVYSTGCVTKFAPKCDNYKTLRHIHFPGITSFEKGQNIQQTMVNANLDFKKMESKIVKQKSIAAQQGLVLNDYEDKLLEQILGMKPFPTLLTFEFENVYTGGKKMKQDPGLPGLIQNFEEMGCKYHQLERGGQVTWHGKGQLVAYVVMDLKQFTNLSVKCYVNSVILKAVQNTLSKNYGLNSFVNENPGVWLSENDNKIASVGCNIQRAITSHGIGLNVNPDLKYLNTFTMCGLPGTKATSIKDFLPGTDRTVKDVGDQFAKEFAKLLNITTIEHMSGEELQI